MQDPDTPAPAATSPAPRSRAGARLALVALVVRDYDEAIAWFADRMGFTLDRDVALDDGKRWVVMTPPGGGVGLLLARAATPDQKTRIGDQTGGRVALFLHTDDFAEDHRRMTSRGVEFLEAPRRESYGLVAVFKDLYGNRWDLIQPAD